MKPNELMLDNIVFSEYDGPVELTVKLLERFIDGVELLTPIKLTREILKELGGLNYKNYSIYNRFRLIYKSNYGYWYVVDAHSLTYLTKIEHVHEWQNFVYTMNSIKIKR